MNTDFHKPSMRTIPEYSGDGDLISAIQQHNNPDGIIADADGNVYFADLTTNRIVNDNVTGPQ